MPPFEGDQLDFTPAAAPIVDPLEDFFERLRKTPRAWYIDSRDPFPNSLRCRIGGFHCPISMVTGDAHDFIAPQLAAAKKLGIAGDLSWKIPQAADGHPGHDPALRARLLDACGLTQLAQRGK